VRRSFLILAGAAVLSGPTLGRLALRSGATEAEVRAPLPGDDLVPGARVVMDRATTLPADPATVWPWIVQLGRRRAGWYFPSWIEAVIPRERRGLRRIDPRWQGLAPGDVVPDWGGPDAAFEVVTLDPARALVYRREDARPGREPMKVSWALVLAAAPGGGTRLHLRLRINSLGRRAPALVTTFGGLMDLATVGPMFAGLRERLTAAG
jgi:hypothetical protein